MSEPVPNVRLQLRAFDQRLVFDGITDASGELSGTVNLQWQTYYNQLGAYSKVEGLTLNVLAHDKPVRLK